MRARGCVSLKSFKDPVHGYCDVCNSVARVVDTPLFQRLRWIRQTGFAYLVYHGMEHSRFNHSLGVAHLAREVLGFLAGNTGLYNRGASGEELAGLLARAVEVFQLAALIHDLGHLPFSHASEAGVAEASRLFSVREFQRLPLRHEAYTYSLIPSVAAVAEEAGVEPFFSRSLVGDLRLVLQGPGDDWRGDLSPLCATNILNKLLSGGLDVDRMDYLLRDSIYAGVRYGVFDVDRLSRVLLAIPLRAGSDGGLDMANSCTVAVLDKGLSVVESFLLARFYMFSEVYLHRVVEAYNSLYARLLGVLARDGVATILDGGGELRIPLPAQLEEGDSDALREWLQLDDTAITALLRRVAAGRTRARGEARELAERLLSRSHPRVYRVVEDKQLWASYIAFLSGGSVSSGLRSVFDELLEMQRENPMLIIRPLRVDLVNLSGLMVYDRRRGETRSLGDIDSRGDTSRLRKLAELGLYRIAVFAPRKLESLADKAATLLEEARRELRREEEEA